MKKHKISFCITCMNRLSHLSATLLDNIKHNLDYPNVDFAILDYGSTDGLQQWAERELAHYINTGIVKLYRFETDSYHRSHSRNMIFKLASGDIVCNLDADNYTGAGFATYINRLFLEHPNCFLSVDTSGKVKTKTDVIGRVCMFKSDFSTIGGYDERIDGYGFEDYDVCNRLENLGRTRISITDEAFLKAEEHGDQERYKNEYNFKNLKNLLIKYIDPQHSQILLLFHNQTYKLANLCDTTYEARQDLFSFKDDYFFQFEELKWHTGKWRFYKKILALTDDQTHNIKEYSVSRKSSVLIDDRLIKSTFFVISDTDKRFFLMKKIIKLFNNDIMMDNKVNRRVSVNSKGFGMGNVLQVSI